jgi:hypothetical protein
MDYSECPDNSSFCMRDGHKINHNVSEMKLFGFSLHATIDRFEYYTYGGIVLANTKEEAIGLICEKCAIINREHFNIGKPDESEYLWEIDQETPGVYVLEYDHHED